MTNCSANNHRESGTSLWLYLLMSYQITVIFILSLGGSKVIATTAGSMMFETVTGGDHGIRSEIFKDDFYED